MNLRAGNYIIHDASPESVTGLATVNYTAWKETYSGIIHDSFMDKLTLEVYIERWEHILAHRNKHSFVLTAQTEAGEVLGYCMGGRAMKRFKHFEAELYALYLLKQCHGCGLGGKLFREAVKRLQQMNYNSMCLFVLQSNPTLAFYRHFNPDYEEQSKVKIGPQEYEDVALGWNDLARLL